MAGDPIRHSSESWNPPYCLTSISREGAKDAKKELRFQLSLE
jgi:hypothetical protein